MSAKCLNPDCFNRPKRRNSLEHASGLCGRCYAIAERLVDSRQTSWATLIETGKCLPPYKKVTRSSKTAEWLLAPPPTPTQWRDPL